MVEIPTLTDGVVTLRAHTDDDLDRCVEQSRDPQMVRWTTVPAPYALDDAKRFVHDIMPGGWATDQEWGFAVEHEGRFAGTVSLRNEGERRAEIAFGAHPDVRGTGAVERACRLLLDWGFAPVESGGRGLQTVIWYAYVGNWASRRLAWRLGFSYDGILRGWLSQRGEPRDVWAGTLRAGERLEPRQPWLVPPVIEGVGLRLRPQAERDLARIVAGCGDPECVRWMRLSEPVTEESARANWAEELHRMALGTAVRWVVADPDSDALLGVVSLFGMDERAVGGAELGYWVHPEARGRGIATTAARAAVRHAVVPVEDGGLGRARVHALVGADNAASLRVLAAAGFREAGRERDRLVIDGARMDAVLFDVLPADLGVA
jgi:RimJ/RimL family protein N-acetyltransferase